MINFLKRSNLIGVVSFLIVLFVTPLVHAAMFIM